MNLGDRRDRSIHSEKLMLQINFSGFQVTPRKIPETGIFFLLNCRHKLEKSQVESEKFPLVDRP